MPRTWVSACVLTQSWSSWPACAGAAAAQDPVITAAGDIACDHDDSDYSEGAGGPVCRQRATSELLLGAGLDAVFRSATSSTTAPPTTE